MSLAESFLNTARDMLMMSENLKRLEGRIDRIVTDVSGIDRRVMRIEVMVDLNREHAAPKPRRAATKQSRKELP